jgi:hypothetical protein
MGLLPLVDDGALGNCGPEWFYYQWWMAAEDVRNRMREIFDRDAGWTWTWWKERQSCRLTRVLSMGRVLERKFGVGWKAVARHLAVD